MRNAHATGVGFLHVLEVMGSRSPEATDKAVSSRFFVHIIEQQYTPFESCARHEFREIFMKTKLFTIILVLLTVTLRTVAASTSTNESVVVYNEPFSSGQGDFTIVNKELSGVSYVWKWKSADYGIVASAYVSGTSYATESWLISPEISLENTSTAILSFDHAVNKGVPTNLKVKISDDGGNSWSELTISQWPEGTNWTFTNASASLTNYVGHIVNIAFCYKSTTSICPQWEVKNFKISAEENSDPPTPVSGRVQIGDLYYNLNSITQTAEVTSKPSDSYSGNITIPETIKFNSVSYSVTSIGSSAFSGCSGLMSITIPNSVIVIGGGAFYGCSSLTSIEIPNSVTEIVDCAFYGCSSLTSVAIGNSVTYIGDHAFKNCSHIKAIYYTESLENWIHNSWSPTAIASAYDLYIQDNRVTDITLPNNVTSIRYGAFNGCSSLTSIEIPNSVTSIDGYAFYNCSALTSVTIPNSVTNIGEYAFCRCSALTSVKFNRGLKVINSSAFRSCISLTNIRLPYGLETLYDNVFRGCDKVTIISIPSTLGFIGNGALQCPSVEKIYNYAKEPQYMDENYYGSNYLGTVRSVLGLAKLYVPKSSIESYKEASIWRFFGEILPLETPEDQGNSIANVPFAEKMATKTIQNGQLFIQRGKEVFNATGVRVK